MNDQLLTTKLQLPILRKDVILRVRLIERLNAGLWQPAGFVRKLTLASAPAGFGKTTLVSDWLSNHKFSSGANNIEHRVATIQDHIAWLSLDESDNDPVRFLVYIIAALRTIQPDFAQRTEALLRLRQPPPAQIILTALVNELSDLAAHFVLALDDYHVIHNALIHENLTFILDHQPVNMHLVILTREDPLLPVARLRARGQLFEIRQDDLRFTKDEVADFLKRGIGLSLGPDEIAALEHHTEGWVAGLQLAALSLRGRDDRSTFIRDFASSERYILDYLIEEVFAHQPVQIQDFLLRTSILSRLTGSLCDEVTGRTDSVDVLRSLEQANLFIVPLDPPHTWYRYHHLFAELLHQRLRLSGISESELHQRASTWFESQGFMPEAVEHALRAKDWANATRLIGLLNEAMLKRGEAVTLMNWCGYLPQEVVHASAELCLVYGWAALMTSRFDIATPLLVHAEQIAPSDSALMGQVASAQAFMARAQRDNARAIEKSELALKLLPETDIANRGTIAMNLGLAYWHEGRMAEAEPALAQACELCSKSGNMFALLTAQIFLARVNAVRGRLHQAAAMDEQLIKAAGPVPILCLAHFDLATIHHEWNDLPKAREHFEQGIVLSQHSGNLEFQQAGQLLKAILIHAEGDKAGALAALSEADALARNFPPVIHSRAAAFGVQLALAWNDPQLLVEWEPQVNADVDAHLFYRFMGLVKVRLSLARGNKAEATEALKKIYDNASHAEWGYGRLVIRILQSLAAKSLDEALGYITEALYTGRPERFIRSFVDAGAEIIPILQEAARRDIEADYTGQILSALGVEKPKAMRGLSEALSERECEVLRLVSAGLSNREIAERLFISPGTAKTHIHNLCGKLGVRNRTEAAMKAKELQLV